MAHRTEHSSVRLGSTRFDRVEQGFPFDRSSRTAPLFDSMLDSTRLDKRISRKTRVLAIWEPPLCMISHVCVICERVYCVFGMNFISNLYRALIEPSRTGPLFGSVRLNRVSNGKVEFGARFGSTRLDSIAISGSSI